MGPLNTPLQSKENDYLKILFGQSFVNMRTEDMLCSSVEGLTHFLRTFPRSISVYSHHCHGSGGQHSIAHFEDVGSIPPYSMWDLWLTKWLLALALLRFLSVRVNSPRTQHSTSINSPIECSIWYQRLTASLYRVSGLDVYKNTCFCFST